MILKKIIFSVFFSLILNNLTAQTSYSFFVAGHPYGKPGDNNIGLYHKLKDKFDYINTHSEIKLGVLTGDIVRVPSEEAWNAIDSDINQLSIPVYFAVGNHDMHDRELYESRYGRTYYNFKYNNDAFIILDPNLDEWNITQEQLNMIDSILNADDFENIYVFFHQVLWWDKNNIYKTVRTNSTEGKADSINFWSEVEPRFYLCGHNVYMFAGDVGAMPYSNNLFYDNYDNITLVASGMGNQKDEENFLVVNVDSFKNIDIDIIYLNPVDLPNNIKDYDIYPNPHNLKDSCQGVFCYNNYLIIRGCENSEMEVYDAQGKKIINNHISSSDACYYLGDLLSGLYICRIYYENDFCSLKIVVN